MKARLQNRSSAPLPANDRSLLHDQATAHGNAERASSLPVAEESPLRTLESASQMAMASTTYSPGLFEELDVDGDQEGEGSGLATTPAAAGLASTAPTQPDDEAAADDPPVSDAVLGEACVLADSLSALTPSLPSDPPPIPAVDDPLSQAPVGAESTFGGDLPTRVSAPAISVGSGGPSSSAGESLPAIPTPDNLVDHYMEVHWESSAFDALCAKHDITAGGVATELDHWLPKDTSSGVRTAVHAGLSMAGDLIDQTVWSFASLVPAVGPFAGFVDRMGDALELGEAYWEQGDTLGLGIVAAEQLTDFAADGLGNAADILTYVQVVSSATGVGLPIAAALAPVGTTVSNAAAGVGGVKLSLSTLRLGYDILLAGEAEAQGNFRANGAYSALASDAVLDVLFDAIGVIANLASGAIGNFLPGGLVGNLASEAKDFLQGTLIDTIVDGSQSAISAGGAAVDLVTGSESMGDLGKQLGATRDNVAYRLGLGDAMKLSRDGLAGGDYLSANDLGPGGELGRPIHEARGRTLAHVRGVNDRVHTAADPEWTYALLSDVLDPPGESWADSFRAMVSPTAWIQSKFQMNVAGALMVGNMTGDAVSSLLRSAASELQTLIDPALGDANAWLEDHKPLVGQMLDQIGDGILQQQASRHTLIEGLHGTEAFLAELDQIGCQQGTLYTLTEDMIAQVQTMDVTPSALMAHVGLNIWGAEALLAPIAFGATQSLQTLVIMLTAIRDTGLTQLEAFVQQQTRWGRQLSAQLQVALEDGGVVESMLQSGWEKFTELADQIESYLDDFEGVDIDVQGGVEFLLDLASAAPQVTYADNIEAFQHELVQTGLSGTEAWRSAHGDDVEQAYYLQVPDEEIDAANKVTERAVLRLRGGTANGRLSLDQRTKLISQLNLAQGQANAQRGKHGRAAFLAMTKAVDRIAGIADQI
ncbi:MAG: hypothetical protein EA397_05415 [Deltaproteobacteria bacterium]|nr:MAG: hypothetical protein EA397_05415 [Deltaproteobacteria bacterium]